MSMLPRRFSNERWRRPEPPSSFILRKCVEALDKGDRFISVSLFTEYVFQPNLQSGRGYTEIKIDNHKISPVLTKPTFRCQKLSQGNSRSIYR